MSVLSTRKRKPVSVRIRLLAGAAVALFLSSALPARSSAPQPAPPKAQAQISTTAASEEVRVADPKVFELVREVLVRKGSREFLNKQFAEALVVSPELAAKYAYEGAKIPNFTDTQLYRLIQDNPKIWPAIEAYIKAIPRRAENKTQTKAAETTRSAWVKKFTDILSDPKIKSNFLAKNDPLAELTLTLSDGKEDYRNPRVLVSHPRLENGVEAAADDLEKGLVDFIDSAEKEIILNVFDFDLDSVADALIAKRKAGLTVMVGIDSGVIKTRPEVKAIYQKLVKGGVKVQAIDSVGLNHQKIIAKDWSVKGKGGVALGSNNYTKSCSSKLGDLAGMGVTSGKSVPNANHMIVADSDVMALLFYHNAIQTVDPSYALRGQEYPPGGIFRVLGGTDEFGPRSVRIAFSPNGAWKDVNDNFIGRVLAQTEGAISMSQFAYSSGQVNKDLLKRALREKEKTGHFDFRGIGEVSSVMAPWSQELGMAGYKLEKDDNGTKAYVPLSKEEDEWLQGLGEEETEKLRKALLNAPPIYGTFKVIGQDGKEIEVTSKLHHKLMISGAEGKRIVVTGSFNFSVNAETNQEIITAWADERIAKPLQGAFEWIYARGRGTVAAEAERRNRFKDFNVSDSPDVEAGRAGKAAKAMDEREGAIKTADPKCTDTLKGVVKASTAQ